METEAEKNSKSSPDNQTPESADEATYLLSSSTTRGSASMSRDPDRKGRPAWRRIVGFLLIVMSSLCVALSTGCVQALERRVPDIELTFGGKFALLLFTLPVYFCKASLPRVNLRSAHWVALYCLLGNAVNVFQYASVHFLPLGTTGCVLRAMQFFIVVTTSRIFLGEPITGTKILTILLCITGATLVSQPAFLFDQDHPSLPSPVVNHTITYGTHLETTNLTSFLNDTHVIDGLDNEHPSGGSQVVGYLLLLATSLSITFAMIVQKLKLGDISSIDLSFWMALMGSVLTLILTFAIEKPTFPTDTSNLSLLIGSCISNAALCLLAIQGLHMTTPVLVCIAFSMQVVFMLIGQHAFLSHILPGNSWPLEVVGAALVVISVTVGATQQ